MRHASSVRSAPARFPGCAREIPGRRVHALADPIDRAIRRSRCREVFPLDERPFATVAAALGLDEDELIARIDRLLADGTLTRFGPLYDAGALGGASPWPRWRCRRRTSRRSPPRSTRFPRSRTTTRATTRSTCGSCSPPRRRGHRADGRRIEAATGLAVYAFPKLEEFFVGLAGSRHDGPGRDRRPRSTPRPRLIAATQAGLPLVPEPYAPGGERIGDADARSCARAARACWTAGPSAASGPSPTTTASGSRQRHVASGTSTTREVDALGERIGALAGRHATATAARAACPLWPYNLFAMVHGRDRAEVGRQVDGIEALVRRMPRGAPGPVQRGAC